MKLLTFYETIQELKSGVPYRQVSNGRGNLRYVEEKLLIKRDGTLKKRVKLIKDGYLYCVMGRVIK